MILSLEFSLQMKLLKGSLFRSLSVSWELSFSEVRKFQGGQEWSRRTSSSQMSGQVCFPEGEPELGGGGPSAGSRVVVPASQAVPQGHSDSSDWGSIFKEQLKIEVISERTDEKDVEVKRGHLQRFVETEIRSPFLPVSYTLELSLSDSQRGVC